eukprot:scaffold7096_cov253-Pinguiococcus_pyrenoidosus.AAC.4
MEDADAWALFGEEAETREAAPAALEDAVFQRLLRALPPGRQESVLRGDARRQRWHPCAMYGPEDLRLRPKCLVIGKDLCRLGARLEAAGFQVVFTAAAERVQPSDGCFDAVVAACKEPETEAVTAVLHAPGLWVRRGGLLGAFVAAQTARSCMAQVADDGHLFWCSGEVVDVDDPQAAIFVRKRSVACNVRAAPWKHSNTKQQLEAEALLNGETRGEGVPPDLRQELRLLEEITLCRTCTEMEQWAFSDNAIDEAREKLSRWGVCVLTGAIQTGAVTSAKRLAECLNA